MRACMHVCVCVCVCLCVCLREEESMCVCAHARLHMRVCSRLTELASVHSYALSNVMLTTAGKTNKQQISLSTYPHMHPIALRLVNFAIRLSLLLHSPYLLAHYLHLLHLLLLARTLLLQQFFEFSCSGFFLIQKTCQIGACDKSEL